MPERLNRVEPGAPNGVARQRVGHNAGHPGPQAVLARLLRRQHRRVDLPKGLVGFAKHEGTRHVGAVAVDDASHINDDRFARLNRPVARAMVRHGTVRATRDDRRERQAGRARLAHVDFKLPRHLAFGHARSQRRPNRLDGSVSHEDRTAHRLDLGCVLHLPQRHEEVRAFFGVHIRRVGREGGAQPAPRVEGEVVGLHQQRAHPMRRGARRDGVPRRPFNAYDLVGRRLRRRLFDVAEVGEDRGVGRGDHHQAGRPSESGGVPTVFGLGDEDGIHRRGAGRVGVRRGKVAPHGGEARRTQRRGRSVRGVWHGAMIGVGVQGWS